MKMITHLAASLLLLAINCKDTLGYYPTFAPQLKVGAPSSYWQLLYPQVGGVATDNSQQKTQEAVNLYLNSLTQQATNPLSQSYAPQVEQQQEDDAQEELEEASQYVQKKIDGILRAIYGPRGTTPAAQEDDDEDDVKTTTGTTQQPIKYGGDDSKLTTTVKTAVRTYPLPTTTKDDSEEDDNELTTTTSATTTTTKATIKTTQQPIKYGGDEDDDKSTTTAKTVVRTLYPVRTTTDEDSEEDNDELTSTTTKATTTAKTVVRTLYPVRTTTDEDSEEDDDELTSTTTKATTTAKPYVPTSTPKATTTKSLPSSTTIQVTYRPTSTSAPPPPTVPNMCDGCDFKHGVGYNSHPTDCTLFVQCRMGSNGQPVVAGVQSCPHGQYWNQAKLTCDYRHNVQCVDDICRGPKKTKRSAASCRGYWDCSSGTAFAKCCPRGFSYNPVTSRCQYEPGCVDDCLTSSPHKDYQCQGMRAVPGDRTVYEVYTGVTWVRMPCPPTLGFSTYPCGCNVKLDHKEQECVPELYLPFYTDTSDHSGRNNWVKNEGVIIKDGKAYFDGKSRLTVLRFSNTWWGSNVYVHLRYKVTSGATIKQALLANGDCQVRPSLAICDGPRGVEFYAETENSVLPANFTVAHVMDQSQGWRDVVYNLSGNVLQGYINNNVGSKSAPGNLQSRQRGLVIGSGGGCEDFNGVMEEVTVYLCRPEYKK